MQNPANDALSNATVVADSPNGSISLPALNGTISHLRQKSARIMLERQYSYDVSAGTAPRVMPRSDPSAPMLHSRQYSEGALVEKLPLNIALSGRNASISSLDTSNFGTLTGMESSSLNPSGSRRRHGHNHSRAHSHHHAAIPTPSKPASMMSMLRSTFSH